MKETQRYELSRDSVLYIYGVNYINMTIEKCSLSIYTLQMIEFFYSEMKENIKLLRCSLNGEWGDNIFALLMR